MGIKDDVLRNIAELMARVPSRSPIGAVDRNAALAADLGARLRKVAGTFVGLRTNPAVMAQMRHSLQEGVDAFCERHGWEGLPPIVEVDEVRPGEFSCRVTPQRPILPPIPPQIRLVRE